MNSASDTMKTDTRSPDVPEAPATEACAGKEKQEQEKPIAGFEDFDLDDIEVIESKVFA